jgi:site-specific DNA-methyltransferase (adenine-specific)
MLGGVLAHHLAGGHVDRGDRAPDAAAILIFEGREGCATQEKLAMLELTRNGDFRERLLELEPGSVDIIVTDPPYPAEFLPLWADLSEIAATVLKPQGLLLAMSGKIQLPDVLDGLRAHLSYGWVYCQPLPGSNTRILARQVLQEWKPWVAFSNGTWPSGRIDWHPDLLDGTARHKSNYRWEQDPDGARFLIDVLSDDGALLVDPFAGTGAFGVAALEMGRRFIGVELDAERFTAAAERLGDASD